MNHRKIRRKSKTNKYFLTHRPNCITMSGDKSLTLVYEIILANDPI